MTADRVGVFGGKERTRIFYTRRISKRILLLLLYWAVSILAFFVFGGSGGGRELLEPVPILASWSNAAIQQGSILGRLIESMDAAKGMILFFCIFLLYLFVLLVFTTLIRRVLRTSFPFPTLILHGMGTAASMLRVPPRHYYQPIGMQIAAWVIPLCLVIAYLWLDWRLAKGEWNVDRYTANSRDRV